MKYIIALEIEKEAESNHEAYQSALNMALSERRVYDNNCQIAGLYKVISPEKLEKIDIDNIKAPESNINPVIDGLLDFVKPKEIYYCDRCKRSILTSNIEWENDTPVCPTCENKINL